jgi:hypothetical protein
VNRRLVAIGAAVAVAAAPLTARAINFTLPPILPDLCLLGGCVTWTHSELLLEIQQYLAMVQNFKNIGNIAGAQGAVQQVIGIITEANAAPPQKQGNSAANQVIVTAPATQTRIGAIDAQARTADGIQEQQQVGNLYLSSIAGDTNKTTALLAEQQTQRRDEIDGSVKALVELGTTDGAVEGAL